MLNAAKLRELCKRRNISEQQLSGYLTSGKLNQAQAVKAVKNWKKGLLKPAPSRDDVRNLASGLAADVNDLMGWRSCCRYAPISPRKARLVTQLIVNRSVQDAMDILKFTSKRASEMVNKVLKAAVADADEQQANTDNLYVSEARVDDAGVRMGTKRWIAKDRGRTHSIRKKGSHIYVTVTEA